VNKFIVGAVLAGLMTSQAAAEPAVKWTGWYAGINAGYGWNAGNLGLSPNDPASGLIFPGTPGGAGSTLSFNQDRVGGAVGGFQFGYNAQVAPRWIAGIEADFNFSGLKSSPGASGLFAVVGAPPGTPGTFGTSNDLKWFGTVRGRAGYLASDSVLLFATGGFAYGKADQSAAYIQSPGTNGVLFGGFTFTCIPGAPCIVGNQSVMNAGWTVGGGTEWFFWKNLSLKAEYTFIDLNSPYNITALHFGGFKPASVTVANDLQYHIVRAGLNLHF
jgi:outer membrane immunogenic protein